MTKRKKRRNITSKSSNESKKEVVFKKPFLILIIGSPGTGKTTLAKSLEKSLQFSSVRLNTDTIRKQLFNGLREDIFSDYHSDVVYRALFYIIHILLSRGVSVIVDGTFYEEKKRRQIHALIDGKAKLKIIHIICPSDIVKERVEKRLNKEDPDSDANFDVHLKVKGRFEPVKLPHLIVSSEKSIAKLTKEVRNYIETV